MQFHLDGFRTGHPELSDARAKAELSESDGTELPAEVGVLIVGTGPAGLTLAAQLAAFPEITTAIVEQRAGPLELGQADGVACHTMEMFNAFGFAHRVLKEAYWVNETVFWKPAESTGKGIIRGGRVKDTEAPRLLSSPLGPMAGSVHHVSSGRTHLHLPTRPSEALKQK